MKLAVQGYFSFMRTQEELKAMVSELCADDIDFLIDYLPKLKLEKNSNHKIIIRENDISCPHCASNNYVKNGITKSKRQKYYCKDCKKSFSTTNESIVFKSKYYFDKWMSFIDCELKGLTLSETANTINIDKTTAFYWRHKLYKALAEFKKTIVLSGIIQIDAKYFSINLKGTKPKNMPRISKRRSSSAYSGISHHKVCVISAIDENDNMFFEITGVGPESNEMMNQVEDKIKDCTILVSDGKFCYSTYCKNHNCINEIVKSKTYKNENGYDLSSINGLHSELSHEISRRKGISIRHLQGYLDMFLFKKMLRYTTDFEMRKIMTFDKSIPTKTKLYINEICKKAIPINLYNAYAEYNYGIFKNS